MSNTKEFVLQCSSCQKDLANIFCSETNDDINWKIKANCPYCGDSSFVIEFEGLFQYCGIVKDINGVDTPQTIVTDAEILDKHIQLKVSKI